MTVFIEEARVLTHTGFGLSAAFPNGQDNVSRLLPGDAGQGLREAQFVAECLLDRAQIQRTIQ